jgi:hypothetical protein
VSSDFVETSFSGVRIMSIVPTPRDSQKFKLSCWIENVDRDILNVLQSS